MFIAFQIPFSDARFFLPIPGKLNRPVWPYPESGREFVRGFGQIRDRRKGGVENWTSENVYCRASRAVIFRPSLEKQTIGPRTLQQRTSCVFRRLLADDGPTMRLEIGLRVTPRRREWRIDSSEYLTLILNALRLSVQVRSQQGSVQTAELGSVGELIAHHYLEASTPRIRGTMYRREDWWVAPGAPVLVVESRPGEGNALPRLARFVRELDFAQITVHHCRIEYRSRAAAVWFLQTKVNSDHDVLRRLRIHLLRVHSEIETLKSIFRAVITQRLDSNSVKVQRYFEGALELLTHKKSHGFQQSEILKAALEWQELVRPGERETLLAKLNEAVPNYRRNIEQLIRRADGEARQPAQLANYVQNVFVTEGDFNMSSINTSGTGNIVNVAEYMVGVTNSVNQNVNNSQTSSEVKDLVKVLMENIAKIGPSVDPNIAKQMADDVKVLSEELTRPAPRKAWYEISLKGLKEAAEAIGEIGKPILETAMKLFPLLIGG